VTDGRLPRAEGHGDGLVRPGPVFGTGQVPVEHAADRISGQVLQDRVDDEPVTAGRPWLVRGQPPRSFTGAWLRAARYRLPVGSGDVQAAGEQAMIERPVELDLQ
jgi:hypothetical protein